MSESRSRVPVRRFARLPDRDRVERYQRAPELGPRILFLSGGNALRKLSRVLKRYTHNSIHIITPFDSGGSSARLREAFRMPSVGDLRNRMLSLADESARGNPAIYALFSHRFSSDDPPSRVRAALEAMVAGEHPLVQALDAPLGQIVRTHLQVFHVHMPEDFDLRNASVGNLILTGGYIQNDRDMESVLFLFAKLVEVRGEVRPVVDADLHLRATLLDGTRVDGQHRLTGKEVPEIESPVAEFGLVSSLDAPEFTLVDADPKVLQLIEQADVVCYPMGSFYTSIVANLLPSGVGRALAQAECPKVYVPNMDFDPEQRGMSLAHCVERIVEFARRDAGPDLKPREVMDFVLVDTRRGRYDLDLDLDRVKAMGLEVVDLPLASERFEGRVDPNALSEILLSLA